MSNRATPHRSRTKGGKYVAIDLDLLTTPRNGEVLVDRWWLVSPLGALFWRRKGSRGWSPQCNSDHRAVEHFMRSHDDSEHLEAVHVPVAYLGPWNEEWGYTCPWLTEDVAGADEKEAEG